MSPEPKSLLYRYAYGYRDATVTGCIIIAAIPLGMLAFIIYTLVVLP